jgi:signal peptidase
MRMARRIGKAVVTLMATLALGALLFVGAGPRFFGYRTLTVLTGSMRPVMAPGSLVVAAPEPASRLRVGDILVYSIPVQDHRVISHRVVSIKRSGANYIVQTKGDANDGVDPWLAEVSSTTVWRVRAVVPGLGFAVRFLRGRSAHLTLVYGAPLMLALIWLSEIWRRPAPAQPSERYA